MTVRYGYIIPILENLEIESQSKNNLPKVTHYVGSRTCIHAHVWLINTMLSHLTGVFVEGSLCGGCSATHFQEHIVRIRTPTASELSRYLVTQFIVTFPSYPLVWPNVQVLIKGIWAVIIYTTFTSFLWKNTADPLLSSSSIRQEAGHTVTEPVNHTDKTTLQEGAENQDRRIPSP